MNSVSPVWTNKEVELERVIALDQQQYSPIIVLPMMYEDGTMGIAVRFSFTEQERNLIAKGADLVITELTFGGSFTPLHIQLVKPEEKPL